jgi:hypothetical protein
MREEDLAVLAGFDAVWHRVLLGKSGAEEDGQPPWAELLQGMYDQWQGLRCMAKCACGSARFTLFGLCAEARRSFCALQTACFLDTGDIFVTAATCNFASCTPYNLRKLYQNAEKLAEDLQNARRQEGDIMAGAASAMERQTRQLELLIGRMLT